MSWTTQALHVARKDVRYTRWALAVYFVLVVVALVHVMMLPVASSPVSSGSSNPLSATMFVLVLLGIVLAATAVQADSPIQSNAFWASRPFDPGALLGAKLIYCGVVILGVPLVAETIGMMRYGVAPAAIVAGLVKSIIAYGLILLCAVVVAGLTTDLRGFIVGALALVIGFALAVAMVLDGPSKALANPSTIVSVTIAVGGAVALLVLLYRKRDLGRIAWLGAALVIGATFAVFESIDSPLSREVPASMRTAEIAVNTGDPTGGFAPMVRSSGGRMRIQLRFAVDKIPAGARMTLQIDSAVLHLRDGSTIRSLMSYGYMSLDNGLGALPAGIRHFHTGDGPVRLGTNLSFDADSAKVAAVGMANIDIWGQALVAEAVPLASTHVGTGLKTSVNGTRLRVFDNFDTDANAITVFAATVADAHRSINSPDIGMAIINESAHEGIVLSASNYSSSNDWMILPGAPINTSVIRLNITAPELDGQMLIQSVPGIGPVSETIAGRRRGEFPEPSWYKNAKIVVVQWIPRGSYPIRLSKTLE